MTSRTMILQTALTLSLSPITTAQWLDNKPLGSCADIKCPPASNNITIAAECKVANQTYTNLGVATFPSSIAANASSQNLTWTMAFHDYTNYDPDEKLERTIEKAFFLGTPENLNLTTATDFHGCAVLLEAYDTVWRETKPWDEFSCNNLIGSECHDELLDQIRAFAREQAGNSTTGNNTSDSCARLSEHLTSTRSGDSDEDSNCKAWTKAKVLPLTGPSAPHPLSQQQNSTSTCYPTLPKTNDLTLITSWNNTGTMYFNDTVKMVNSVNVALTVFWGGKGSRVVDLESHVNCLVPVDETTRSRETKLEGEDEGSGAGRVEGMVAALLGIGTVMVWGIL